MFTVQNLIGHISQMATVNTSWMFDHSYVSCSAPRIKAASRASLQRSWQRRAVGCYWWRGVRSDTSQVSHWSDPEVWGFTPTTPLDKVPPMAMPRIISIQAVCSMCVLHKGSSSAIYKLVFWSFCSRTTWPLIGPRTKPMTWAIFLHQPGNRLLYIQPIGGFCGAHCRDALWSEMRIGSGGHIVRRILATVFRYDRLLILGIKPRYTRLFVSIFCEGPSFPESDIFMPPYDCGITIGLLKDFDHM